MAPRYKLLSKHFFAPDLVAAGTVIEYDGEPNVDMLPINPEAEEKMNAYREAKPYAFITVEKKLEMAAPTLTIVSPPESNANDPVYSVADMAAGLAARPIQSVVDARVAAADAASIKAPPK